ncbi:uncharacterized protein SETTUDRAFT_93729 [Exserohilum turcica Et28A]|uniref:GIY-YIG domain-containing protein n=1 Tax=Exserohilum turcicum (strain 28A) TaxID=671987 RepID=R0K7L8_EXST2|nr:uncharacterized protein SETTUDRAFT_93729 [Exserohilum turcica Et28A]EOA84287.1 hypothetical protein SETTUDRAFT_93729 [Exserohilum turcica Et28A]
MESRPIPAFYCCYLLRSRNRKALYIGSTPNPARRLGQHNGSTRGGAKRTSMQAKRPWEMTCIVTGFPSSSAALQFEWAWQNTHATRHIDRETRRGDLSKPKTNASPSRAKRNARPPRSLHARLKNLHHLLGAASFTRWPLHIRFFASDVFAQWEQHMAATKARLPSTITVRLTPAELPRLAPDVESEMRTHFIPDVIRAIPVAYQDCKSHVQKSKTMFEDNEKKVCAVCKKSATPQKSLLLVCPAEACRSVSHVTCLSQKFLAEEGNQTAFIPIQGTCPTCHSLVQWSDMAKELSLRMRGQEAINAMFKTKRGKKADGNNTTEEIQFPDIDDVHAEQDEDLDETWAEDVNDDDDDDDA